MQPKTEDKNNFVGMGGEVCFLVCRMLDLALLTGTLMRKCRKSKRLSPSKSLGMINSDNP